jgi:hypothetical protein
MGLELKGAMFSKKLKQTMAHPLPGFHGLLLYFLCSKNICSPLQFADSMTQKSLNSVKE